MYNYSDRSLNGFSSKSRVLVATAEKPNSETPISDSRVSYLEWRDIVITILFKESGFANIPYIARIIQQHYLPNRTYETIRTTIHRLIKRLSKDGYVRVFTTGGLTYVELLKLPPDYNPKKVDWILNHASRKPGNPKRSKRSSTGFIHYPASYERYLASSILWERPRPVRRGTHEDKARVQLITDLAREHFKAWFNRVRNKVIVLRDPDTGELKLKRIRSRFTDPYITRETLFKFNRIYRYYAETYKVGVFLTITFPPILPLGLYPKVASYVLKQLMAWIRKNNKGKEIRLLRVNEFQENGMLHLHIIIFGISRIADKRELTIRLDLWFVNAILRLYNEIPDRIVNLIMARYLRYCRTHKKYQGPLNWITPIDFKTGVWNPPPDYVEFLEKKQQLTKQFNDGGYPDPGGYLSKYMHKFIRQAAKLSSNEKPPDSLNLKFLMYWITGIPFFYVDKRIYKKLGLSRRRETKGYQVVGVFNEYDLPDFMLENPGLLLS